MQRFTTAKFMLGLFIFAGWIVVAVAVVAFFLPLQAAPWIKIAGLLAGSLNGFLLVAVGQMGLAQIATAENTRRMVELFEASSGGMNTKYPPPAKQAPKVEPTLSKPK